MELCNYKKKSETKVLSIDKMINLIDLEKKINSEFIFFSKLIIFIIINFIFLENHDYEFFFVIA